MDRARLACVLIPSLALACELAERPQLAGEPVALTDAAKAHVVDCSERAARYGIRPGQPLRSAMALCPGLAVLVERPAKVARIAEGLADAMTRVTPVVEQAAPGQLYADLHGLEGLYPHQALVERALLDAVPAVLPVRLGLADTRFTAFAAACAATPGVPVYVATDEGAAFLEDQPAAWLPLEAEAVERLRLLGVETIGDYAALPAHAVAAQFGPAGRHAWLCARGTDPTALRVHHPAHARVVEQAHSEPPLVSREAVTLTSHQLLIRALRHPQAAGRFARSLRLRAVTEDERLWERTKVLREPCGGRDRLWQALRPLLEFAEYPGPIAELELELAGLTAESGRQPSLLGAERVRRREHMDDMVRHLKVRYGTSPVARMVEVERWSRIPERRWALMDYDP
jgi:DNA polymerase-4/protein ImuB